MKYESWSVSTTHSVHQPSHHRKRGLSPSLAPGSCSWRNWRRPNWRRPWCRTFVRPLPASPRFYWRGENLYWSSEPFVSLFGCWLENRMSWLTQGAGSRWSGTRQVPWLSCSCSWLSPGIIVMMGRHQNDCDHWSWQWGPRSVSKMVTNVDVVVWW